MSMGLTGYNLVGQSFSAEGKDFFQAVNPRSNAKIHPHFYNATSQEVETALGKASAAYAILQQKTAKEIALFLYAIRNELLFNKEHILLRYKFESGLSDFRANTEFERTILQIEQFAEFSEYHGWHEPSIDTGFVNGEKRHSDVRKMSIGIGPVVVFGASNFPLAYSTAGTDTISALTAGCPVILKAHPYHPGTSELVAQCLRNAVEKMNFPDGTFSHLFDEGYTIANQLVLDKRVKAVGFTGSESGGRALYDLANSRPEPIPVFAEMGSSNPIIVLPNELENKKSEWSKMIAHAVTNDAGQFCTKPGLIFVLKRPATADFLDELEFRISSQEGMNMLHPKLHSNYKTKANERIKQLGIQQNAEVAGQTKAIFVVCSASQFKLETELQKEVFGPFTLIVQSESLEELTSCIDQLEGQLTGSVFGSDQEFRDYSELLISLRNKVGRIILNGVPTGVTVCPSMHHGGPYPSSTDSRFSSVGIDAIRRFTRPQTFQNWPDELLPAELKNENPLKLNRRIDGNWTFAEIKA